MPYVVRAVIAEVFTSHILVWCSDGKQKNVHYVGYGSHKYSEICRLCKSYFMHFMSFIDLKCLSLQKISIKKYGPGQERYKADNTKPTGVYPWHKAANEECVV